MSDDQNSYTSNLVPAGYGGQIGRPVMPSIATARCSWLTRIGDLPGMYHVSTVRGHAVFGRSPLCAQTETLVTPGGSGAAGTDSPGLAMSSASAMRKNSGAAASTPTNAGFPCPSKLPIQTINTYGPTMPADHASRNPQDVPVFHATGQRVRTGIVPSSS